MSKKQKKRAEESQKFFDASVDFSEDLREMLGRKDSIIVLSYPKPGTQGPVNFFSTCEKQLASMILASAANQLMGQIKKEQ